MNLTLPKCCPCGLLLSGPPTVVGLGNGRREVESLHRFWTDHLGVCYRLASALVDHDPLRRLRGAEQTNLVGVNCHRRNVHTGIINVVYITTPAIVEPLKNTIRKAIDMLSK